MYVLVFVFVAWRVQPYINADKSTYTLWVFNINYWIMKSDVLDSRTLPVSISVTDVMMYGQDNYGQDNYGQQCDWLVQQNSHHAGFFFDNILTKIWLIMLSNLCKRRHLASFVVAPSSVGGVKIGQCDRFY